MTQSRNSRPGPCGIGGTESGSTLPIQTRHLLHSSRGLEPCAWSRTRRGTRRPRGFCCIPEHQIPGKRKMNEYIIRFFLEFSSTCTCYYSFMWLCVLDFLVKGVNYCAHVRIRMISENLNDLNMGYEHNWVSPFSVPLKIDVIPGPVASTFEHSKNTRFS